MAIRLQENPYAGVNAHLQSMLQAPGSDWPTFHTNHITDISYALNAMLPSPYRAYAEKSLQIRVDDDAAFSQRRKPDLTVYELRDRAREAITGATAVALPTWAATIEETIETYEDMPSVVIYRGSEDGRVPVVRMELLSPANKFGGSAFHLYEQNRIEVIHSGLPLIEIDYLHETLSPVRGLPVYPEQPNAYAYHFTVTNPRLSPEALPVRTYGFGVDDAFPKLPIPLAGDDDMVFDFGVPYGRTFTGGRWWEDVDYAQEPERMETYSQKDQAAIRARMAAVEAAQEATNE
jgi:hypothetical protein